MNEPPIITVPNVDPGEEVIHDLDTSEYIVVVGDDPDSEDMMCWWDVSGQDRNEGCIPGEASSFSTVLKLEYDPDLDGELVIAHVYDYESLVEVEVNFRIIVGGELL